MILRVIGVMSLKISIGHFAIVLLSLHWNLVDWNISCLFGSITVSVTAWKLWTIWRFYYFLVIFLSFISTSVHLSLFSIVLYNFILKNI